MSGKQIIINNLQYCALQFLYWMLACSVVPFTGIFLLGKGYSNSEISVILASGYIVGLILQTLTASFAGRVYRLSPSVVLSLWCGLHLVLIGCVFLCRTRSLLLSVLFICYFSLQNALRPHINSFAFYIEKTGVPIRFGMARGCGSLSWGLLGSL